MTPFRNRCWRDWRIPQSYRGSTSWTWRVGSRKPPAAIRNHLRTVWTCTRTVHAGENKATAAYELVRQSKAGIDAAAGIARANNMVRAFAIAPTASCSYRSKDLDGFTCTPEIAPPIAKSVDRDSGTFGVETYEYGDVEIASEVGWDNYKRVADGIMRLYNSTGLLHGYSYNWWSDLAIMDECVH